MQARFGASKEESTVGATSRFAPGSASIPPLVVGPDLAGNTLVAARGEVLEHGAARPQRMPGDDALDARDASIQPGKVDAHSRAWRALASRGMPRPTPPALDHPGRQHQTWWALARAHDRWSLAAAARLFVADALLAGTTTLVDHHESPRFVEGALDVLADACQELGARALLGYAVSEREGGREEAERELLECRRFLLCNGRPLVRGAVGLDSSFNLSDATIRAAVELATRYDAPLLARVAEDPVDVRHAQGLGFASPIERLEALGALGPRTVLAPCTYLTEDQVRRACELGAWIAQTPSACAEEGSAYGLALSESDRVALGSGGHRADLRAEAAALSALARRFGDDATRVGHRTGAGRQLASELMGVDLSLAPGSAADFVVGGHQGIRHVVVGGRVVVRDGELVTARMSAVEAEADDLAARLWGRMRAA